MKKLGLAIVALAAILFVIGCVDDDAPLTSGPASVHKANGHTYHSKLGRMSTKHDTEK